MAIVYLVEIAKLEAMLQNTDTQSGRSTSEALPAKVECEGAARAGADGTSRLVSAAFSTPV